MSSHHQDGVAGLTRVRRRGVEFWTDSELRRSGVVLAFTGRSGGVSESPFSALNLAAHVGDDPERVNRNRDLALEALELDPFRSRVVCAEQVHGAAITVVGAGDAGAGAIAGGAPGPIPATDALMTAEPGVPLMMFFADCVPIILVAPGPVVAVVHAGWRGALASIPSLAVAKMRAVWGVDPGDVDAYVGAHIGPEEYEIDERNMSHFINTFGTVARAESGGLDLGAVVNVSLVDSGVDSCSITALGLCTAQATDRLFSYRAEGGLTGRHAAIVCILPR